MYIEKWDLYGLYKVRSYLMMYFFYTLLMDKELLLDFNTYNEMDHELRKA